MAQRKYEYQPKEVDQIVIRAFAFEFPDDLDPIWVPGNPVRSHMFNGLSLTMPYLEPYLILSNKEAMKTIDDSDILADMRAFNGQEGCHYQCHRSLNEILKTNGYPELARVEERMDASFERLKKKSLRTQLAYNAGFETMSNGVTHWLINQRTELFRGASPHVASFWLMHMVEETEHKTVAFDAYMAYSGQYFPRAIGVFHGSFHLLGWALIGMWAALKKDKALRKPSNVWSLVREVSALAYHITPYMVRSLRPWHNPRCEDDPQWMKDWLAGYATLPRGALIPLIDTTSADMPVPFNNPPA